MQYCIIVNVHWICNAWVAKYCHKRPGLLTYLAWNQVKMTHNWKTGLTLAFTGKNYFRILGLGLGSEIILHDFLLAFHMIYFVQPHRQTMQPAKPRAPRTIVHEKAHPVVPNIPQSRLKCINARCIHRPLRSSSRFHLLNDLLMKIFGNIPSAPGLNQFACMTPSTFTILYPRQKAYEVKYY